MGAVAMGGLTRTVAGAQRATRGKLVAWLVFTFALAALSYWAQAAADDTDTTDALYEYPTAIAGAGQYAIMLTLALVIASGGAGTGRELLGLRRPRSWPGAVGATAVALVVFAVVAGVLGVFLDAGEEQGLVPDAWDPDRAGAFAANFVVVACVAPVVEELIYRGLGLSLVGAFAPPAAAVAITALMFGLAHGLVIALPVLTAFGLVLGVLRLWTDSVYPPIALHGVFNAGALVLGVTLGV